MQRFRGHLGVSENEGYLMAIWGDSGFRIWGFPKIFRAPDFGVLIIRILLFRVLFSETPTWVWGLGSRDEYACFAATPNP